jgi:hypothetical protein
MNTIFVISLDNIFYSLNIPSPLVTYQAKYNLPSCKEKLKSSPFFQKHQKIIKKVSKFQHFLNASNNYRIKQHIRNNAWGIHLVETGSADQKK